MDNITTWLTPLNFHEVHKDTLEKVTPGTATWILSHTVFLEWLEAENKALIGLGIRELDPHAWLYPTLLMGMNTIAGAGKTCLT